MTKKQIALVLLKMLTKQNYRNKAEKDLLSKDGYISEKGNVTSKGKDAVYEYYG